MVNDIAEDLLAKQSFPPCMLSGTLGAVSARKEGSGSYSRIGVDQLIEALMGKHLWTQPGTH